MNNITRDATQSSIQVESNDVSEGESQWSEKEDRPGADAHRVIALSGQFPYPWSRGGACLAEVLRMMSATNTR